MLAKARHATWGKREHGQGLRNLIEEISRFSWNLASKKEAIPIGANLRIDKFEKGASDHWYRETQRGKKGEKWARQAFSITVFVTAQIASSASEWFPCTFVAAP